jgi:transposase
MRYKERCYMKRQKYLRDLRELGKEHGFGNIIYIDESGFKRESYRPHGWSFKGKKIYGSVSGNNRKAVNLIMGQRQNKWLAPETFEKNCNAKRFNAWLKDKLLPLLKRPSVIVIDNARFHKKEEIRAILDKDGHVLLPLPPYSPDFNPIENSFGIIKSKRQYLPPDTSIMDIIKSSDSYLE